MITFVSLLFKLPENGIKVKKLYSSTLVKDPIQTSQRPLSILGPKIENHWLTRW